MNPGCIAVFDSGVGGLTVLAELQRIMPGMKYVYLVDNAFFPYGTKSDHELIQRLTKLLPPFVSRYKPDLLVVACNTASTIALEDIRKCLPIPVVGVVPAIKPAGRLSKTRVIALLATEATVRRKYTEQLIEDFASDCELLRVGSRNLVEYAEAKLRGERVSLDAIKQELEPIFAEKDVDTVVLACTHFDHLRVEFEAVSPRPLHWLSSSTAVALRAKSIAESLGLQSGTQAEHVLVSTSEISYPPSLLQNYGFAHVETMPL